MLRELPLKRCYSSDSDDILKDFYLPALSVSTQYRRLAGFFSSTAFALAARGILGLVRNGGTMRLIVAPRLTRKDLEKISEFYNSPEDLVAEAMLKEIDDLEEEFVRDHVFALAWMLAQKKLEIKVAIPLDESGRITPFEDAERTGIFHQKVGILEDAKGDIVTFSGSINETAQAWLMNVEEFKVFRSWEDSEREYAEADVEKFERFWNNKSPRARVVEMPEAVKEKLVSIAPDDISAIRLERWYAQAKRRIALFPHQEKAIEQWISHGGRGILEMATGTGKTYTAMGCLERIWRKEAPLIVVITFPRNHLLPQWEKAIKDFGCECDGLVAVNREREWKKLVHETFVDVELGYKKRVVVLISHDSFSSEFFRKEVSGAASYATLFVIADEVHGLGAPKLKEGLLDCYQYRLGLSATPERYFDSKGTKELLEYFEGVVFRFTLADAVTTINPDTGETYLTPYEYFLKFVPLERDEVEKYLELVSHIRALSARNGEELDEEIEELIEQLRFKKAKIVKAARSKLRALEDIVEEIGPRNIHHTLVYCDENLLDEVVEFFTKRKIIVHRFTMQEGTRPEKKYGGLSEREFLIREFGEGVYQVLAAIKCLDEGVDVPPARRAILMSSSGNPREFIQRIGRILRRYPGKERAVIYDMVAYIPSVFIPPEFRWVEKRLLDWEFNRCLAIARCAENGYEVLNEIFSMWEKVSSTFQGGEGL